MTQRELSCVLIKLIGVFQILTGLWDMLSGVTMAWSSTGIRIGGGLEIFLVSNFSMFLLRCSAGLLLLWYSEKISGLLFQDDSVKLFPTGLTVRPLLEAGIILIAVWMILESLPILIPNTRYLIKDRIGTLTSKHEIDYPVHLLQSFLTIGISLMVILKLQSLVQLLDRFASRKKLS